MPAQPLTIAYSTDVYNVYPEIAPGSVAPLGAFLLQNPGMYTLNLQIKVTITNVPAASPPGKYYCLCKASDPNYFLALSKPEPVWSLVMLDLSRGNWFYLPWQNNFPGRFRAVFASRYINLDQTVSLKFYGQTISDFTPSVAEVTPNNLSAIVPTASLTWPATNQTYPGFGVGGAAGPGGGGGIQGGPGI